METNEKRFESDIEAAFLSPAGGYVKGTDREKLMNDTKLQTMAKTSDPQIFAERIFPKAFGTAAQDSHMESQDTYTLFEDQAKYNAIMYALGSVIYREMRMNP